MKPPSSFRITVDGLDVEVTRKRVKNLNLRVTRPDGQIKMSVPPRASQRAARDMVIAHRNWIRRQQAKLKAHPVEPAPLYETGEIHYVLGDPCRLVVSEKTGRPRAHLSETGVLHLAVRPGSPPATRERVLHAWHRWRMKAMAPAMVADWAAAMGVAAPEVRIRRMKTRWGTCNIRDRRIWLNLALMQKPAACLEYVIVHELAHLFERRHNHRFKRILDETLPDWRRRRDRLNGRL